MTGFTEVVAVVPSPHRTALFGNPASLEEGATVLTTRETCHNSKVKGKKKRSKNKAKTDKANSLEKGEKFGDCPWIEHGTSRTLT